jgi:hypothetical protein
MTFTGSLWGDIHPWNRKTIILIPKGLQSDPKTSGTISLQSPYILIIIFSGCNKAAQFNQFLSVIPPGHICFILPDR